VQQASGHLVISKRSVDNIQRASGVWVLRFEDRCVDRERAKSIIGSHMPQSLFGIVIGVRTEAAVVMHPFPAWWPLNAILSLLTVCYFIFKCKLS
jgi:hypothetical protein